MNAALAATDSPTADFLTRNQLSVAAVVWLFTTAIFLPAVWFEFLNWDDHLFVTSNAAVLGGFSLAGVRKAFTEVVACNWAPLTTISLQLDASLFGDAPWGFHLTNVVLHAAATAVLYLALARLTGEAGRSLIAAAFFGIHPMRAESVAWVSERKDVLSVLILALTMLAYARYCRRPTTSNLAAVFAGMICGLLAKATLVTLPVLLLLIDIWPLDRAAVVARTRDLANTAGAEGDGRLPWTRLLFEKTSLFCLSLAFVVITLATQTEAMPKHNALPLWTARIPNAAVSLCWYVQKTLWPTMLSPHYRHLGEEIPLISVALAILIASSAVVGAAILARQQPWLLWGLAWYVVSLLPVLGIIQVGSHGRADRFAYVPHVGLIVAIVWCGAEVFQRRAIPGWVQATLAIMIGAALILKTEHQLQIWRNSEMLWQHALRVDPDNPESVILYASAKRKNGDNAAAERLYQDALSMAPPRAWALADLASIYYERGDFAKALQYHDWAVRLNPNDCFVKACVSRLADVSTSRGGADRRSPSIREDVRPMVRSGMQAVRAHRYQDAYRYFRQASIMDPACGAAHNNLGMTCIELDRQKDAETAFRNAVACDASDVDYRMNLLSLLVSLKRWPEVIIEAEQLLRMKPDDVEAAAVLGRANRALSKQPMSRRDELRGTSGL